jgi:hypothetical protein
MTARRVGRAARRLPREVVDARAKAVTDAMALKWLQDEWDQLVRTVEGLRGELEATVQEHDAAMRLDKEREQQAG